MDGALQDLNDLHFFAAVVRHGGFSAAGRALGIAKSRLSKRVAKLEERLGVRLLQRTTRRFVVTEVGERFYRHCQAMLEEARAAEEVVEALRSEPRGIVRVSCPVLLAQSLLAPILPGFLLAYPKVQLKLLANNRRVDVIGEGYDVAIRVRERLDDGDATLVLRRFAGVRNRLVASPALLARAGPLNHPSQLANYATLSMFESEGEQRWSLLRSDGSTVTVELRPQLMTGDFTVLLEAAIQGVGIALLPEDVCAAAVKAGRLQVVLADWEARQGILHFVYPSRRGMLPAVRSFIDFLAERLPSAHPPRPLAGDAKTAAG